METRHCGTGLNDSSLKIFPDTIEFYESAGPVLSVDVLTGSEIKISTRLTGEGETRLARHHFRVSSDGSELSELGTGAPVVRKRCP